MACSDHGVTPTPELPCALDKPRRRPSHAVIVSYLALVVALGGTSYAAVQLPRNSVGTPQIRKSAVTAAKIKDGTVASADIRNGSVGRADLAAGAVRPTATFGASDQGVVRDYATFGVGRVLVTKFPGFAGTYCVSLPDLSFPIRSAVGYSTAYDANVTVFIGSAGNCPADADLEVLTTNVQATTGVGAPQDREFNVLLN